MKLTLRRTPEGWSVFETPLDITKPCEDPDTAIGNWIRTHRKDLGLSFKFENKDQSVCPFCEKQLARGFVFCPDCGTSSGQLSNKFSNPNRRITEEIEDVDFIPRQEPQDE